MDGIKEYLQELKHDKEEILRKLEELYSLNKRRVQ